MTLYSYVVARDFGFAPNPFYGFCTLATCKPEIRRTAGLGDWIIGTGSKRNGREHAIVYAMHVTETLTFNQYWADPRFHDKRPFLTGSKKQAFGDNIYFRPTGSAKWHQANSHHSLPNGTPNPKNVEHDTQTDNVLISSDYVYWGGSGPKIPAQLRTELCKVGPGHKSTTFTAAFVGKVIEWVRQQPDKGYAGAPHDWAHTA